MTITTVGIDLAKKVFAVHCVDQNSKTVLVKSRVTRAALPGLIAGFPPCVIGMEACSGAHYWTRLFQQYGHEPRLMAAKFVSPNRLAGKSGKNDAADAQAICEAVRRPHLRFVSVKDEGQQAMQCLHRTRQGFIEEKTAIYNRLRGLISEFGVIAPQSRDALRHMVSKQKNSLPLQVQQCVDDLLEHVDRIEANIAECDRILSRMAKTDHRSQRLRSIDLMDDALVCGRHFRTFNVVDDFDRRTLVIEIDLNIPTRRVIRVLDRIVANCGYPQKLRMDNCPGLISLALEQWAEGHVVSGMEPGFDS